MSKYNCCVCGMQRVPELPSGCVAELSEPGRPDLPLGGLLGRHITGDSRDADDVCLCPSCACSNPAELINCLQCQAGVHEAKGEEEMKAPTCVICGCNPSMRTPPACGIRCVELSCLSYNTGSYGFDTHAVCAGCAASNLEDVFEPHQEGVRRAIGETRGKKQ
jgi:hypothetical protein